MMKPQKLTEGSSIYLDIIRSISVQLVVIGHGINYCSIGKYFKPPYFPYMQNVAVIIFFILSGFLISNSVFYQLATNKDYSFRSYLIDRFSRIYSAFIPALIFVIVVDYFSIQTTVDSAYIYSDAFNLKTFFGNIFMLQDYPVFGLFDIKITSFGSARPLWTLAIEWWIYLWFGYLMINILKEKKRSILSLLFFVFLCIVPAFNLFTGRGNALTIFWLFGVLIVLGYEKYKTFTLSTYMKFLLIAIFLILGAIRVAIIKHEYDIVFAFCLASALVIGMELCSTIDVNKNVASVIRFIANYSYTLYLIHYSIFDYLVIHYKETTNPYFLFLLSFIISNLLSLIIGYYTETKLTKFVKSKLKAKFT